MEARVEIKLRPMRAKAYASFVRRAVFANLKDKLPLDEIKKIVGVVNAKLFEILTEHEIDKEDYIIPEVEIELDVVSKKIKDLKAGITVLEEKEVHKEDIDIEEMLKKLPQNE